MWAPDPQLDPTHSMRGAFASPRRRASFSALFRHPHTRSALLEIAPRAGRFDVSMSADNSPLQRILIVEDEENARKGYEALLRKWNCEVLGVPSGEDALAKLSEFNPQVILADVELPGMNGLDLLRHLGEEVQRIPVIIITGRGSDERVVQAIDAGAFWYIEKPLKPSVLQALMRRALELRENKQKVAALTRDLRSAGKLGALVGSSGGMQDVMRQIETAAPSTASVLITGETGSGKE